MKKGISAPIGLGANNEKQKEKRKMINIDNIGVVALSSSEELECFGGNNPLMQYGNDLMVAGGGTAAVGTLVTMSGVGAPVGAAAVIVGSAVAAAGAGLYAFGSLFGWMNPGYFE